MTAPTGDGVVSVPVVGGLHAPTIVEVRAEDLEPGDELMSTAIVLNVRTRNGLTVVTVQNPRALVTTISRITVAPDVLFEVIDAHHVLTSEDK